MFDTKINNNGNIEKIETEQRTSNALYGSISWSAIFTGVICTLILHIILTLLGTAIGTSKINLLKNQNPFQHLDNSLLIWIALTMILSISIGSYMAGRLAKREGALHGLLVFSLTTLITLWLGFSFASNIFSTMLSIANYGLKETESNIGNQIVHIAKYYENQTKKPDDNLNINLKYRLHQTSYLKKQNLQKEFTKVDNKISFYRTDLHNPNVNFINWLKKDSKEDSAKESNAKESNAKESKKTIKVHVKKVDQNEELSDKNKKDNNQETKKHEKTVENNNANDYINESAFKATWFTFGLLVIEAVLSSVMGMLGYRNQLKKL
ncbi:hypothetical protein CRV09_01355 [Candidatus Pantoea edessiphila]|uniref:Uncharacterized protein n=1 Tax=Candidatus Pantoea edessiphila TaxID=2044610 RepID=A0A2P5T311_9GAMM|nr:YrzE family protein [Candidatus Pantoea edessiphila]PPI88930.1 hypothetical protein CRV09_01355 [Candidatus Pantoea edessiphila]